jgi:hypothetical protein
MSLNLDLSNVVEQGAALPDGLYNVVVEKAELVNTKAGDGQMIKAQFKVLDGPNMGRNLFTQFNISNPNPLAAQIGLGQLKGMLKSFGHPNPQRLESCTELLGLKGTVKTKQKTDDYGTKAEIKNFGPLSATPSDQVSAKTENPFG